MSQHINPTPKQTDLTSLNSNLGQFTRFNASSRSEIQTNLLSSANALENRQTIVVGFYSSISGDALFRSSYVYAGNLYVNYKVGNELMFSASLHGPFGENIDISYQNGTWYYGGTKELNSNLNAFSTVSFTPESGITSDLFIRRYGRIVCVNGYLTANTAFSSNQLVGYIQAGHRPDAPLRCPASVAEYAYSAGDNAYIAINADGTVRITTKAGNTYKVCYFTASYVVLS